MPTPRQLCHLLVACGAVALAGCDRLAARMAGDDGVIYAYRQDFGHAEEHFLAAIELDGDNANNLNSLAWLRATCPIGRYRNGAEAVRLAQRACELTEFKNPMYLDTLAAACAESGDFPNAVKWQELATDLADESMKADFRDRLVRYQSGETHRDP